MMLWRSDNENCCADVRHASARPACSSEIRVLANGTSSTCTRRRSSTSRSRRTNPARSRRSSRNVTAPVLSPATLARAPAVMVPYWSRRSTHRTSVAFSPRTLPNASSKASDADRNVRSARGDPHRWLVRCRKVLRGLRPGRRVSVGRRIPGDRGYRPSYVLRGDANQFRRFEQDPAHDILNGLWGGRPRPRGSPWTRFPACAVRALCVLAQPVAEGVAVENNFLARILQVSLAAELIHVVSDDLTRCADILGEQFVREWRHPHRAILLRRAEPVGETDQRAGQTARDVIHTETFDAVSEIDGALRSELDQRHGQPRTLQDEVLDLGGGPGHHLGVFQSRGLLAAMRQIQERGLAKKLVGLVDVDNHLVAVVGHAGDFDFTGDNQVDVGGRLVLIVDHQAFLVLHDARAGQMCEGIFE